MDLVIYKRCAPCCPAMLMYSRWVVSNDRTFRIGLASGRRASASVRNSSVATTALQTSVGVPGTWCKPCDKRAFSSVKVSKMSTLTPIDIFRVSNILGEGILWDSRREVLWWTDIQGRLLHRYDWTQ